MKYNLDKRTEEDIIKIAKRNSIKKIILFGSRARGDNSEKSDIDLAVCGGNASDFYYDIEEEAWTLLMFDVIDMDKDISRELQTEIERDGIIIYEEV